MANPAEFHQPALPPVDGHAAPQQPDGAVVSALPHAARLPVPPGV